MDKNYWENYYTMQNRNLQPSLFAETLNDTIIHPNQSLIELGCGNGRDAVFFANEGLNVLAIDQCEDEIKFLYQCYHQLANCNFLAHDFTCLNDFALPFDIVYSRFTLHAIAEKQENQTLEWAFRNISMGGYFCIEARGTKNEIYKLGKKVEGEENAYIYEEHYRRFLDFETICNKLKHLGFTLEYAKEQQGFAPFNGGNETFIRIIAKK